MHSTSTDAGELPTDVVEDGLIAGPELTWASKSATEVEVELAVEPESTGARMAAEATTGSKITGANGWAMKVEVECAAGSKLTGASALVTDVEVELTINGAALVACIPSKHRGPDEICKTFCSLA